MNHGREWTDHLESSFPRVLVWGLRRYSWLLVVGLIAGALAMPAYRYSQPPKYEASALVVASELQTVLTALPRLGTSVFDNGAVAEAVAAKYGTDGDSEDVVPQKTSLTAPQDSIVMEVWGYSSEPDEAAGIANTAAKEFVEQMNLAGSGVGIFKVQSAAEESAEAKEPFSAAPYSVVLGAIGGLIFALGVLLLVLAVRRPVLDGAKMIHGLPVAGVVEVPRRWRIPLAGATAVVRHLLQNHVREVFLLSSGEDAALRSRLAGTIEAVASAKGDRSSGFMLAAGFERSLLVFELSTIESPELVQLQPGQGVLIMLREGVSSISARRLVESFSPEEASVVIVRSTSRDSEQPAPERMDSSKSEVTDAPLHRVQS